MNIEFKRNELYWKIQEAKDVGRKKIEDGEKILNEIRNSILSLSEQMEDLWPELMLAYRDVKSWEGMISLYENCLSDKYKDKRFMKEQYAYGLNRRNKGNDRKKAEEFLLTLVKENSETCGILGRVYNDMHKEKKQMRASQVEIDSYLNEAIKYFKLGFECDWSNYYTGINAATLMLAKDGLNGAGYRDILGFLRWKLETVDIQNIKTEEYYWVVATTLEVNVLYRDWEKANDVLWRLIKVKREPWMIETTINNLTEIREALMASNVNCRPLDGIMARLLELKEM